MRWISLVLLFSTGCSFVFVRPASSPLTGEHNVECTKDYFTPVYDTVVGTFSLGLGLGLAIESATMNCDGPDALGLCNGFKGAFAILGGGLLVHGLLYGMSAVHGYKHVSACRDYDAKD